MKFRIVPIESLAIPPSGWVAIHGEALTVLPLVADNSIDAVITDPPYCSGGFTEQARRAAKGQGLRSENIRREGWFINDNMGTAGIAWLLRQVAVEAYRMLKPGGSFLVFCDWRMIVNLAPAMESSGLRWQNLIVWNKGAPGLGVGFRPEAEYILHFVKGVGRFYAKDVGNVLDYSRVPTGQREHQTEKPVELFADLVRVASPLGGVVLDPFAGSFASGEAALTRGRQYIGLDWARAYVVSGGNRLQAAAGQPRLFEDPDYVEEEPLELFEPEPVETV